ncbi:hypothetical protein StoSoilB5_18960 [Arthrobacter sp. StoSoilB5]|nr:hypothetical protein StoSoilB5_18960 [Arthrobacter sp. StoSoilB5]
MGVEHDPTDRAPATTEIVDLRGGRGWELRTESGELVVVDRGFSANGGRMRDRWKVGPGGALPRLFWVGRDGASLLTG